MRAKLGLREADDVTAALVDDLLGVLQEQRMDYTSSFRMLSRHLRGDRLPPALRPWGERWREQLTHEGADLAEAADAMDRVNPVYVARNQRVEEALAAATEGDLGPVERIVDVLRRPYDERPGLEAYAEPAPESWGSYQTFCGT